MATTKQLSIVIFDIGGVLTTISKKPMEDFLTKSGVIQSAFFDDDFYRMQRGHLKPLKFLHGKSVQLNVDPRLLKRAFADMIDGTPALPILSSLKLPYLFLSNINQFHFQKFRQCLPISLCAARFSLLSYQVGHLKPSQHFFRMLDNQIVKRGESVLYIDDKQENLISAGNLGFRTELCKSPHELQAVLDKYHLI